MTDTEIAVVAPSTYTRSASIEVVDEDEGRVLGRIVPFGETAHIREPGPSGEVLDYDEQFLPGCTSRVRGEITKAGHARFLGLQLGHNDEPGIDRLLGFGLSLAERDDGAYAEFQLYRKRADYEHVREMLATAWRGLSVAFRDRVPPIVDGRLVGRRQVDIVHIAAVPRPAYASAGVVSIRGDESMVPDTGTPHLDAAVALLADLRAEITAKAAARL